MVTTPTASRTTPCAPPSFYKLTKLEYTVVEDDHDSGSGKQQQCCHLISFGDSSNNSVSKNNEIRIHNNHGTSTTAEAVTTTTVQLSDGEDDASTSTLRAIACSPDGRRVAVGYDDGSTRIYTFDKVDVSAVDSLHPFLRPKKDNTSGLEIDINIDSDNNDDRNNYFAGPRVSASIRDLAFDPRSSPVNGYLLAVASEDHSEGNGLFVVNVSSSESVMESKYLVDESQAYGGVRSLSYSTPVEVDDVQVSYLAALGQDGFLTVYSCNGTDTPDVNWQEWYHSNRPVVSSKDLGYAVASMSMSGDMNISGADDSNKQLLTVYDRAASLAWAPDGKSLSIAGCNDVELRCLGNGSSADADDATAFETPHYVLSNISQQRGHSNVTVASAFNQEDGTMLVTLGKDGRICAWDMDPKACANPTANVSCSFCFRRHSKVAFDGSTAFTHIISTHCMRSFQSTNSCLFIGAE
jgi:WD40 repeat protein